MRTFRKSPFILKDGAREVRFYFLGWAHTRGDGFVWLPKERILCTGDAAVNGPHNKLFDAFVANWPRVLDKTLSLHPTDVLPGHGPKGGPEILTGQKQFLLDLYFGVKQAAARGEKPGEIRLDLPIADQNWLSESLEQDIEVTYRTDHAISAGGRSPPSLEVMPESTLPLAGYTGKRTVEKRNGNGQTRLLLSGSSQQAGKRRACAQRSQGSRREFRCHLGL